MWVLGLTAFSTTKLGYISPQDTHTHPFNGPLSRTTRVSRYQKVKTSLDFTEARDSEWQWHQLDRMQVCISLQTDNHASTPPLSVLQAGCPSCRPANSVKELKATTTTIYIPHHITSDGEIETLGQLSLASLRGHLVECQLWLGVKAGCHLCQVAGNTCDPICYIGTLCFTLLRLAAF